MSATEGTAEGTAGRRLRAIVPAATLTRVRRRWARFAWGDWLMTQFAIEAENRSGFFVLPVGLILGIAAVYGLGWRPNSPVWPVVALCLLVAAGRSGAGFRTILLLFGFALGGASLARLELSRSDTIIFSGEATVRIEGRVLWRDRDERGRFRYLVALQRTERPFLSRPPQRAEILVSSKHQPIPLGASYRGLVRLRAPSGPALPGGYDFAFGTFFERLGANGFALGPPDAPPAAEVAAPLSPAERLVGLRLAISDHIRDAIGGAEGAVASAIITGERTGIPDDVDRWLRATGLSHVLSISGLHMALVAGFAMTLVRCLFASVQPLTLHWPAKKLAAIAALCVSAFYLALSGVDVATTRSFIMIAIMLTAVVFDRSALTLRNVAIAAIVVLATTPHALMTASFQMSFGATAAIVAAYGGFVAWRRSREDEGGVKRGLIVLALLSLVGIAASSMIAGLATAPYAAYHFQRIAPFGLIANMLVLPIFSFWIMPLALIAMIAMPFGLDAPVLWLIGQGLSLVFAISHFLYDRLPDDPTGLVTATGLVLLTVALLTACFLASALRLAAIPIAVAGLAFAPEHAERPELLIFEDGREAAIIDPQGTLLPLKTRPNAFVFSQWQRAYPSPRQSTVNSPPAFSCETIAEEPLPGTERKARRRQYCRAKTRSGFRIAWTDDYRLTGRACDEGDVAIIARAIKPTTCRSDAVLVTLRTLRTTGSLAIGRTRENGKPAVRTAMENPAEEWNRHRFAPWPEAWRKPQAEKTDPEETSKPAASGKP